MGTSTGYRNREKKKLQNIFWGQSGRVKFGLTLDFSVVLLNSVTTLWLCGKMSLFLKNACSSNQR